MPSLYRLYRPAQFADIAGQEHVTQILQQAILRDRVSHAYLFQGPRGTGKTTTARVFAKRLNCKDPQGAEPCGKCDVCVATQEQRNMDIVEIDAASNRGIDDIRQLRETVGLSPTIGSKKIYIIDEVHMLTNEAFAALLKTLEEPVAHAVFILATTELHKVPDTILSRCQVFRFRRASDEDMRKRLSFLLKQEKRKVEPEVLSFVISRSEGCYRDAESLLGQLLTMEEGEVSLSGVTTLLGLPAPTAIHEFLQHVIGGDAQSALALVKRLYEEGYDPELFITETMREARDGLVALTAGDVDAPAFAQLPAAGQKLPVIIRALIQARQDLAFVPQPLVALQLAVFAAAPVRSSPAPVQAPVAAKSAAPTPPPEPPKKPIQSPASKPAEPGTVAVNEVMNKWPEVIDALKKENPVGSTFLRATEPVAVEGNVVIIQVQFPLHRSYFEKPQNKEGVEKALSDIFGQKLVIQCRMDPNTKSHIERQSETKQKEDELLQNVKEVFGIKG